MVARKFASAAEIQVGTAMLVQIVFMLFGLIRADSDVRVFEQAARYRAEEAHEGKSRKSEWE